jgi:DNA-binding transcriptional LysR family regulator
VHFAICASPAYLARFGEPQHPAELSTREVLVYSNIAVGRQWYYQQDGKRVSPRMKYRLSANNGEFLVAVARRGQGIVSAPLAYLQDLIERGELVQILTSFSKQVTGMYAVYPPGRLVSQRVRVFSDALYAHFLERRI